MINRYYPEQKRLLYEILEENKCNELIKETRCYIMNKCVLCWRKWSNSQHNFGLGCLKRACNSVGVENVKNLKAEDLLNKRVLELTDKKSLLKSQRQLLTDRYLTLQLLNEVPIASYDRFRNLLKKDIQNINRNTRKVDSSEVITLKQASKINKVYKKNENIFQKIMNGEYDIIQNIAFSIISLAFSLYYSKKEYLSDELQWLQYYVLQGGVNGLKIAGKIHSAEFLEHALQENPQDLVITDGKIIDKIKEDGYFKAEIDKIIKKYGNEAYFDTGEKTESFSFNNGDLFLAIHSAYIHVIGEKQKNNSWNLDITLSDLYDFTEFKTLKEYLEAEDIIKFLAIVGNNIAMLGTSCNVVHTYNVTIKFKIENWKEKK